MLRQKAHKFKAKYQDFMSEHTHVCTHAHSQVYRHFGVTVNHDYGDLSNNIPHRVALLGGVAS